MKNSLIAILCSCWLMVGISSTAIGQDTKRAVAVLEAMSKKYQDAKTFKVTFTYTENGGRVAKGEAVVKGNKYILKMADQEIVSDGKVMATFLKETNEVTLQEDSPEVLGDFSPTRIFTAYKNGFKNSYLGEITEGGAVLEQVHMIPVKANGSVSKVELKVNKADKTLKSWKILGKNNQASSFTITSFVPNTTVADAAFTFNAKNYPKAEVIDLR